MSLILRIVIIVMSLFATYYAVRKIRKSQMKIEYAMYWFLFALMIIILSFFPELGIWLAGIIGVESPVNLIYLIIIFLLMAKIFSMNIKLSQLENKITSLTEEVAIWINKFEGKK